MDKYERLLEPVFNISAQSAPQYWADFGCGSGVFTNALATHLPAQSQIIAIDKIAQQFPDKIGNDVAVAFQKMDIETEDFNISDLDGILMANVLHFIKDKISLIQKLEKCFKNNVQFIIVEYDHNTANPWEPFPIPYVELIKLFSNLGYQKITKIGEQKSIYGGLMYACLIEYQLRISN